jgi:hypothetical protein
MLCLNSAMSVNNYVPTCRNRAIKELCIPSARKIRISDIVAFWALKHREVQDPQRKDWVPGSASWLTAPNRWLVQDRTNALRHIQIVHFRASLANRIELGH